ncbi:MAG: hypothetical protein ACPH74_02165 [Candidatus Puniceispirillum sp.]
MLFVAVSLVCFSPSVAANSVSNALYIKAGDVVVYVPITHLKDKSNLQIVDIISVAVERAIHASDGLTSGQIKQAVTVAGSAAHANVIASRVQMIYAQAMSTGIDIETLVKLDNLFVTDELIASKSANMANFDTAMGAAEPKPKAIDVN